MRLATLATAAAEQVPLPDALTRYAITAMVGRTQHKLASGDVLASRRFAAGMKDRPIAEFVSDANAQHYEVPARFFEIVLGPRRKSS